MPRHVLSRLTCQCWGAKKSESSQMSGIGCRMSQRSWRPANPTSDMTRIRVRIYASSKPPSAPPAPRSLFYYFIFPLTLLLIVKYNIPRNNPERPEIGLHLQVDGQFGFKCNRSVVDRHCIWPVFAMRSSLFTMKSTSCVFEEFYVFDRPPLTVHCPYGACIWPVFTMKSLFTNNIDMLPYCGTLCL